MKNQKDKIRTKKIIFAYNATLFTILSSIQKKKKTNVNIWKIFQKTDLKTFT